MPFPILGSNSAVGGYEINNSLRFNPGDSPRLNRTTSTATDDDKATLSVWCKRSTNDANQTLIGWDSGGGAQAYFRVFNSGNNLQLYNKHDTETATSVITDAKFRDNSAWYHVVLKYDAAQSTASDRVKFYINGEEQSLGTADYPPQNTPLAFNYGGRNIFVACWNNSSEFVDGYISEFNYVDGQALAPTDFGETNDNGVWIPKRYEGTYGTNGFYLKFADSSDPGVDSSGNGNDFTSTNLTAQDNTTDTPTNNFATMNPLSSSAYEGSYTFAEGNTEMHWTAHATALSTIGVSSGKWYVEVKKITSTGSHNGGIVFEKNGNVGTLIEPVASEQSACGIFPLTATGELYYNQTQQQTDASWTFAVGDILQYYIDLDNGTLKVKKNGSDFSTAFSITLSNSNDYSSGATTFFAVGYNGDDIQVNFGNPAFSISSSNSDPNGYGSFEYSTNDGTYDYYALCTKNLAEYG